MLDPESYNLVENTAVLHSRFLEDNPDPRTDFSNEEKALRMMSLSFLTLLNEALEAGLVGGQLQEAFDQRKGGIH